MTHWLAAQMPKGGPFSVNTLVGPDGTVWNAGDLVYCMFDGPASTLTNIDYIFPGQGDIWEPCRLNTIDLAKHVDRQAEDLRTRVRSTKGSPLPVRAE